MVGETDPPVAAKGVALACPRCGAPLPIPGADGFATCEYCGVRTIVSGFVPPERRPSPPEETFLPFDSPPQSTGHDSQSDAPSYIIRAVIIIVTIVVIFAAFAASQPQSNSGGPSVANCSVAINASATSGPAPFTATFTAEVKTPPGDVAGDPMWQFGPFLTGLDINYTYGPTVSHTWSTNGSYGVDVSVPDSSLQGCWTTMSVTVT